MKRFYIFCYWMLSNLILLIWFKAGSGFFFKPNIFTSKNFPSIKKSRWIYERYDLKWRSKSFLFAKFSRVAEEHEGWRQRLIDSLKADDFHSAAKTYRDIKEFIEKFNCTRGDLRIINNLFSMFASICRGKEHLSYAQDIFHFTERNRLPLIEQSYYPLLRCYADAGEIDTVYNLLKKMKAEGIELKYRNFLPLIDFSFHTKNLSEFIHTLLIMEQNHLYIKSEEFVKLLSIIGNERIDNAQSDDASRNHLSQVHRVLMNIREELYGLNTLDILRLAAQLDSSGFQKVKDQLIAPEKINESVLPFEIQDNETLTQIQANIQQSIFPHPEQDYSSSRNDFLQLVEIAKTQAVCPSCGASLQQFHLQEHQKQILRNELYIKAGKKGNEQIEFLKVQ